MSRRRSQLALHTRFARGYQLGFLVVIIIVGGGVWWSTQAAVRIATDGVAEARLAAEVAGRAQTVGSVLGEIEDDPTSLVLRSDLSRQAAELESAWGELTLIADPPPEVRVIFEGNGGLDLQMKFLLDDAAGLAEAGAQGADELSTRDAVDAGRLEAVAGDINERLFTVIRSYEARGDDALAGVATVSHLTYLFALAFLGLLILSLLRPLKRQLMRESGALREANAMHQSEAARQELATHLSDGLEAAESEEAGKARREPRLRASLSGSTHRTPAH